MRFSSAAYRPEAGHTKSSPETTVVVLWASRDKMCDAWPVALALLACVCLARATTPVAVHGYCPDVLSGRTLHLSLLVETLRI